MGDRYLEDVLDERIRVVASRCQGRDSDLLARAVKVFKARYGIRTTRRPLEDIGKSIGVTRERVRQVEAKLRSTASHSDDPNEQVPEQLKQAIETIIDFSPIERHLAAQLLAELGITDGLIDPMRLLDALKLYPPTEQFHKNTLILAKSNGSGREWIAAGSLLGSNDLGTLVTDVAREKRFSSVGDCLELAAERCVPASEQEVRNVITVLEFVELCGDQWICSAREFRPQSRTAKRISRILEQLPDASNDDVEAQWHLIGGAPMGEAPPPIAVIGAVREFNPLFSVGTTPRLGL